MMLSQDGSRKSEGILYLKGIVVTDTRDGYTTEIRTDFAIVCPSEIDFAVGDTTSVPDAPVSSDSININDCVMYVNWEKR